MEGLARHLGDVVRAVRAVRHRARACPGRLTSAGRCGPDADIATRVAPTGGADRSADIATRVALQGRRGPERRYRDSRRSCGRRGPQRRYPATRVAPTGGADRNPQSRLQRSYAGLRGRRGSRRSDARSQILRSTTGVRLFRRAGSGVRWRRAAASRRAGCRRSRAARPSQPPRICRCGAWRSGAVCSGVPTLTLIDCTGCPPCCRRSSRLGRIWRTRPPPRRRVQPRPGLPSLRFATGTGLQLWRKHAVEHRLQPVQARGMVLQAGGASPPRKRESSAGSWMRARTVTGSLGAP